MTPQPFAHSGRIHAAAVFVAIVTLGTVAAMKSFGAGPVPVGNVEIENLGPGNVSFPVLGTVTIDETIYVGSRNLSPSRVAGFDLTAGRVASKVILGNGLYVQSLATDGQGIVYAGVSHTQGETNLYRYDLRTGEVDGVAVVPGQSVAALAVASDGTVYTSGRPDRGRGPTLYSWDPETSELAKIAVPRPDAGQSLGLAVTDTTVYFGCGVSSAGGAPAGLFAIDRDSGVVTDILPPEMADDRGISKMEVFEDILVVASSRVGVMDIATGKWRFTHVGGRQHQFARIGDAVIAGSSGGLHEIDLETWNVSHRGDPGAGLGDYQGVDVVGDLLAGSMSGGHLWTFDRETGECRTYDLIEAGASGGGEAGQSVGTLSDKVYVGGNNSVAMHDLGKGTVAKLAIPGEVKDMLAVGDTMYMATYAPAALWKHRPDTGEPPKRIRRMPPSQNRPIMTRWDDVNERLVIGIRSDAGGGSLCFFDPVTEDFTAHIDPLGDSQWVYSVAPADGLVYIAGTDRGGRNGHIAAWDPVEGRELWRMESPLGEGGGVSALAVIGDRLYGIAIGGPRLFVIDISPDRKAELIHEADLGAFAPETTSVPRLIVDRGVLYGVTLHSLFRIDPGTFEPELLVKGLDAEWYSGPRIAVGENHSLYTFTGRDLLRIRDNGPR